MAEDRVLKLRRLERLRRRVPHASVSALTSILRDVSDDMPELGTNRGQFREARDSTVASDTPYGTIVQQADLPAASGGDPITVYFAAPFALLWHVCSVSKPFWHFLKERLAAHPSTAASPWKIIAYSDEVTPGNVMATDTTRKSQVIYWAFVEWGSSALSREDAWFTFTEKLSSTCSKLVGGLSRLFRLFLICLFKCTHNFTDGIVLQHEDEQIRLYAKLGFVVQDGGAHKQCFHHKGDGGTNFCMLCLNAFAAGSDLALYDPALPANLTRFRDLALASNDDIRDGARKASIRLPGETMAHWQTRQQVTGWTATDYTVVTDPALVDVLAPADVFMHDWMHGMCSSGVFNDVLFLLLSSLGAVTGVRAIYLELQELRCVFA